MARLKREQLLLLTLVIAVIIVGCGVLVWQKVNNQPLLIDTRSGAEEQSARTGEGEKKNQVTGVDTAGDPADEIVVHVAGEVVHPGVYQLPENARVCDAVRAAGGETVLAELDSMNLAQFLHDGERIYIPAIKERMAGLSVADHSASGTSSLINVNRASAEELQSLNGIGPSKAGSIIEYRNRVGGFKDKQQLLEVSGIGQKTLEKFIDDIVIR